MSESAYPPVSAHLEDPEAARTEGRRKMEWALQHMPILQALREEFETDQPLDGETIGMAMHVEAKTANLVELLALGGAAVAITGCNPLSTHDDVSAALDAHENITSYAVRGVGDEEYYDAIDAVIDHEPTITVDDGCDMIFRIHEEYPELIDGIVGGVRKQRRVSTGFARWSATTRCTTPCSRSTTRR